MLILILSTWKFKLMLVISCAMLKIIPGRGKKSSFGGMCVLHIQLSVAHVCVCVCMPMGCVGHAKLHRRDVCVNYNVVYQGRHRSYKSDTALVHV